MPVSRLQLRHEYYSDCTSVSTKIMCTSFKWKTQTKTTFTAHSEGKVPGAGLELSLFETGSQANDRVNARYFLIPKYTEQ